MVEVTFGGDVDAVTGMVVDLGGLDAFAKERVVERFDVSNLNCSELFLEKVPTTENLAIALHGIFAQFELAELVGLRVEETGNNSFEYQGK